jgi:hypothetical protein
VFFFLLVPSTKSENRKAEQVLPGRMKGAKVGVGTRGRGEVAEKEGRRVNKLQKMCIHVCKCKNDTC